MDADDPDALYAKLYVLGAADTGALQALLADLAPGRVQRRNLSAPPLDIDVFAQPQARAAHPDDFVNWPAYLEVGASAPGVTAAAYLAALAALVAGLRARGLAVQASCAFEDELAAAVAAVSPPPR